MNADARSSFLLRPSNLISSEIRDLTALFRQQFTYYYTKVIGLWFFLQLHRADFYKLLKKIKEVALLNKTRLSSLGNLATSVPTKQESDKTKKRVR